MPSYQDPNVPFVPNRNEIPLHEPVYPPITTYNAKDATPPPRFTVKPPDGAPNVLIVLIDDMGYGASSAFGGPVPMPNAERIAKNGMRFNRFHTTAVCAPTRTALLTGYNHHTNNMGSITEMGTAFPGNTSTRPKSVTPMARVLRDNGYSTAQFGKCHETPVWEVSVSGPFDHWPTYSGFDKFYGFMAAETDQWAPNLFEGTTALPTPTRPGYHLSEDLAEHCIEWINEQKALTPDKPFFCYFAPGATHAPHQVPKKYADMFKGQFDEGWDVLRERTLENMKKLGICPPETQLAPKPAGIMDWNELDERHRKVFARQMEVYAGYAHHIDEQVGKVFDTLENLGILDDTIIYYILGDNGASAEGNLAGVFNEMTSHNHVPEPFEFVESKLDDFGSDRANNHYSACWAVAMDAPFTWTKQVASNFGGTRNGMIFHWPKKYKGSGECHPQFHHVIDIAPTIYELTGVPHPDMVDGVKQRPIEGVSMKYAIEDKAAEDQRKTQYFTIGANTGIYHDGWFCGCVDKAPWFDKPFHDKLEDNEWELYNLAEDWACAHDLAKEMPEKVEEMRKIFVAEAEKYNVLPIDNRATELLNPAIAGRPTLMGDRKETTLSRGMFGIKENAFLNTKNHSFSIQCDVEVFEGKTDGLIFHQGGRFGGYGVYVKDGVPVFVYNFFGMHTDFVRGTKKLQPGKNQIKVFFKYDGGGWGKGGLATLTVNNQQESEGRIEHTTPFMYDLDGTVSCGQQQGMPLSDEYTTEGSKFQGDIYQVIVKIED